VGLRYETGGRWEAGCELPRCQDTLNLLRAFGELWKRRPETDQPRQVYMVLSDLVPARSATQSLFEFDRQVTALSHAMDRVNRLFGRHTVRFGTVFGSEETAPTRIAFNRIPQFDPAFV
jgi:DNA polymerase-4